ncbi:molecular chaperone TorD family protein [Notoacmeibacter marinus]|uniref:molecular chaperone TorD family protein n=1 Tax=Notoacmeibacter marinus TaxID=1876515 RepID=UPI0013B05931|nr:molecular chaperone TorD family protein [Notoacmeibacter marinus]
MAKTIDTGGAVEPALDPDLSGTERAGIYRWFCGLFAREMSVHAMEIYRSEEGRTLLYELGTIEALTPVVTAIRARLSDARDGDLSSIALDFAGEFSRLFLGAAGPRSAPPYQSFYTGESGRLMQFPSAMMQDEMRALNVRIADSFAELPDHLAVQLAVMAELAEAASAERQAIYLRQRLDWTGAFRSRCLEVGGEGFYPILACALDDFVCADVVSLTARAHIDD